MKKTIYLSIFILILSCNKKEESEPIKVTKVEFVKPIKHELAKKNTDSIVNKNSNEDLETILSLEKKIVGKWEVLDFVTIEEDDGPQEKSSGIFWTFKDNYICEERSDSENPNNVTIYEYVISKESCEKKEYYKDFFYINLKNKTVVGDDYCFMVGIYKNEGEDCLSLYSYGAISADILKRR